MIKTMYSYYFSKTPDKDSCGPPYDPCPEDDDDLLDFYDSINS